MIRYPSIIRKSGHCTGADDQYHPFHIHDVQFYILDRKDADGKNIRLQSHELGRKDVVHVGPEGNRTVHHEV